MNDMTEPSGPPDRATPQLTLVTLPACHFCDDAHTVLGPLAEQERIRLRTVEAESPEGQSLIVLHRPAVFPLVLIDGEFLSAGRLPRRRLADALGVAWSAL